MTCAKPAVRSRGDALAAAQYKPGFAVVLGDLNLPGLDGIALLGQLERIIPDAVRILMSGDRGGVAVAKRNGRAQALYGLFASTSSLGS